MYTVFGAEVRWISEDSLVLVALQVAVQLWLLYAQSRFQHQAFSDAGSTIQC